MGLSFYRIELQHVLTLRMLVRLPEHSKQSFLIDEPEGKGNLVFFPVGGLLAHHTPTLLFSGSAALNVM